uniref:CRESS-DNA virus Rep endonuclease domain-containing protein n=1 Tax=Leiomenia cribrosa TaxID=217483 RepID=A0A4D6WUT6_9FLOR|nr:hypothetical protein [Leiomenia cribrosa]
MNKQTKKFRISSKGFILTYPQSKIVNEKTVTINKEDLEYYLQPIFEKRIIEQFIIAEEESGEQTPYRHFHVFIRTKFKKEITRKETLDVKGIHGNYQSTRNNKQTIEYIIKGPNVTVIKGELNNKLQERISPFGRFMYLIKFRKTNPEELLSSIKNA